jgi:hypothetical protein
MLVLNQKYTALTNNITETVVASNNIVNSLVSSQAKQQFNQLTGAIGGAVNNLAAIFTNLNQPNAVFLIAPLQLTNYFELNAGISGFQILTGWITNEANVETCISGAGFTPNMAGFTQFTNDMAISGIVNPADLTNCMPLLNPLIPPGQSYLTLYAAVADYFGIPLP